MRPCWIGLSLLAAGCDLVLGIEEREPVAPIDAPDEHDEDSDGLLDPVDNCPSVPNPLQTADDMETVGIVCDPHRNVPGDQIVRTVSAYFATSLEPFAGFGWGAMGDAAITTTLVAGTDSSLTASLPASSRTSLRVAAVFTIRELGAEGGDNGIALEITIGTASYSCSIREDSTLTPSSVGTFTGTALTTATFFPPALSIGVPHQLIVDIDADSPSCELDGANVISGAGTVLAGEVTLTLRARRMKVEVGSIMVYDTP